MGKIDLRSSSPKTIETPADAYEDNDQEDRLEVGPCSGTGWEKVREFVKGEASSTRGTSSTKGRFASFIRTTPRVPFKNISSAKPNGFYKSSHMRSITNTDFIPKGCKSPPRCSWRAKSARRVVKILSGPSPRGRFSPL